MQELFRCIPEAVLLGSLQAYSKGRHLRDPRRHACCWVQSDWDRSFSILYRRARNRDPLRGRASQTRGTISLFFLFLLILHYSDDRTSVNRVVDASIGRGGAAQSSGLRWHRWLPQATRADQRDGRAAFETPAALQDHWSQASTWNPIVRPSWYNCHLYLLYICIYYRGSRNIRHAFLFDSSLHVQSISYYDYI